MVQITEVNREPATTVSTLTATTEVTSPSVTADSASVTNAVDAGSVTTDTLEATGSINTADVSAATDGQALTKAASGTGLEFSSVGGKFETALSNGQVLADDGNLYDSVQTAENNATDYLFIGPGTFNEVVTVDTAGLTVVGSGRGTVIDGTTSGTALTVSANDCDISNLATRTDTGTSNLAVIINGAQDAVLNNVTVIESGATGIRHISSNRTLINKCRVESADVNGIRLFSEDAAVTHCSIQSGVGGAGIQTGNGDQTVSNCLIDGVGENGVELGGKTTVSDLVIRDPGTSGVEITDPNCVVDSCYINNPGVFGVYMNGDDSITIGCQIIGAGDQGVEVRGTDNIVANNRVSGSTDEDIRTSLGTNTITDANLTGDT